MNTKGIRIKLNTENPLELLEKGNYEAAIRTVTVIDAYTMILGSIPCAAYDPVRRLYIATPLPPVTEPLIPGEPPERYNIMNDVVNEVQADLQPIIANYEEVYFP